MTGWLLFGAAAASGYYLGCRSAAVKSPDGVPTAGSSDRTFDAAKEQAENESLFRALARGIASDISRFNLIDSADAGKCGCQ